MKRRYGLEVRAATAADAAGLSELLGHAGFIVPVRALAERIDAARRGAGAVLIVGGWGPPAGVVALHWHQTLGAARQTAHISMLLVNPDERRRGIGRLLLKAASQAARVAGCGTIILSVGSEDQSPRAFCEATGFNAHGTAYVRPLRKQAARD